MGFHRPMFFAAGSRLIRIKSPVASADVVCGDMFFISTKCVGMRKAVLRTFCLDKGGEDRFFTFLEVLIYEKTFFVRFGGGAGCPFIRV
ncbi:MAG: hypothetical protein ACTTKL_02570 [Treponema sp.]